MRRRFLLAILMAAAGAVSPLCPAEPASEGADAGQALAQRIRSAEPEENSEIHGTLIIRAGGRTRKVPVVCRVALEGAGWKTDYETPATTNGPAERLTVIHSTNGPNLYFYSRAGGPAVAVPASEADIPLAGSDFSLTDLGLEYLHWPQQLRFRDETRLGQACYVLESRNPAAPGGIARVKSYIDKETGGLLVAEAYDAGGRENKEFSLHGSSFKKVNGHWRLEKMDIRDAKNSSQTELKFDMLDK